ncbi:hypothetical protein [Maridesulfovibrio ferrireducens]|uniref:hypothetical protein n=1 Tax=Maridesulfovibrio ferrireducens TaxID=246191 RepID=UPI001A20491A|nr:hypothetical protein [Maridesulfovibrio ferrireducens]MBI9112899.1 hypothetical protein [Maridesulfovibrio ferrireducens]
MFKKIYQSVRSSQLKNMLCPEKPFNILLKTNLIMALLPGRREDRVKILEAEDNLYRDILNAFSLVGSAETLISENMFDESFINICEGHVHWAFAILDSHYRMDLIAGHPVQHFISELMARNESRVEPANILDFFDRFIFDEDLPSISGSSLQRAMGQRSKLAVIQFASLWRLFKTSNHLIKYGFVYGEFPIKESRFLFDELELLAELLLRQNSPEHRFQLESERNRCMRDLALENPNPIIVTSLELRDKLHEQQETGFSEKKVSIVNAIEGNIDGHDEKSKVSDDVSINKSADYVTVGGFDAYTVTLAFMAAPFLSDNPEISCPDLWEAMRKNHTGSENAFGRNESEKVRRTVFFDGKWLCNHVNDKKKSAMEEESFLRNYNAKVKKVINEIIVGNS